MRVLLVTNTYPPQDISGVGTLTLELARQLAAAGHEATVLTRRAAPDDPHAHTLRVPKLLFPLAAGLATLRLARRRPYDVVHVHESDGVVAALVVRLARRLGHPAGAARVVATLQVSYRRERRAVRPVRAGGRTLATPTAGERLFAWGRAPLLAALGRATVRLADRVVAPSRATAAELAEDYGAGDVVVIPNGVAAPPADASERRRMETGTVVFLYAGRLRTRKAVAVLVEAFRRIADRASGARLVLVGDGEQRPALEAQVGRLGLSSLVTFAGAVPRDSMARHYAAADVFCLPSLYEGFPLAIVEAMAAGLPVVATAVAGNPEAIEDGVTGLLVPPGDVDALAGALVEMVEEPEGRRRMGEAGRRRAAEELAIPRIAEHYLELWRELVPPRAARADGA